MTKSRPLQFLEATTAIVSAVPGAGQTYYGRYTPVGSNELTGAPVIIVRNEGPSESTPDRMAADESDGICYVNHRTMVRIAVYYNVSILDSIDEVSDGITNAINAAMITQVAALELCAGLRWLMLQKSVESEAACVVLYYEAYVITKANDWSLS